MDCRTASPKKVDGRNGPGAGQAPGGPGEGAHGELPGPLCVSTGSKQATPQATSEAQIPAAVPC